MRPLEIRLWFELLSLGVAVLLMMGMWWLAGLPVRLAGATVFLFATLGLGMGINKALALLLIRWKPSLGAIG